MRLPFRPILPHPIAKAVIIEEHPGTSIKEQTSGLHAWCLAVSGFHAFAFDAAQYGESGGGPHYLEESSQSIEDFKNAASFL